MERLRKKFYSVESNETTAAAVMLPRLHNVGDAVARRRPHHVNFLSLYYRASSMQTFPQYYY